MTTYRIYIDGHATDHTYEAETEDEAIEAYKHWCIEDYRDIYDKDPDQDRVNCWIYEARAFDDVKTLDEIRSITNSHDALEAMEDVAAHFNIAYDDPIGCYPNKSEKNVDDCDNYKSIGENGDLVFGWDNDNENADHAMDLIRYINDTSDEHGEF